MNELMEYIQAEIEESILRLSENKYGIPRDEVLMLVDRKGWGFKLKERSSEGFYGPYAYFMGREYWTGSHAQIEDLALDVVDRYVAPSFGKEGRG